MRSRQKDWKLTSVFSFIMAVGGDRRLRRAAVAHCRSG
jgi:hypothetical protein